MGIRDELIETIQQFNRDNDGREPTKLFVTRDDEQRLAAMSEDEAGGRVSGKVREDWVKIGGVPVVWDADIRHCE